MNDFDFFELKSHQIYYGNVVMAYPSSASSDI